MCWAPQPNLSLKSRPAAQTVLLQRSHRSGADLGVGRLLPQLCSKTQFLILIIFFSANIGAHAADLQRASTIELSTPSDVGDAKILNNAVDAMSNKVMECVKNKTARPDELPLSSD